MPLPLASTSFNKSETATATFTFSKTDLNGDGTIDVGDIMAIINQMARNTAQ